MATERRNLYRILYVQPEAPPEVIKAAWRALMTTLRMHPDLGGDAERAARINVAYETLSDPERRRAYDQSLWRSSLRTSAAGASAATTPAAADPSTWLADRRCPFCRQRFRAEPHAGSRCTACDGPLCPAPGVDGAGAELVGRRRAPRVARSVAAWVRLPGVPGDHASRLRDASLTGLSIGLAVAVPAGSALRVVTDTFDALAVSVGCQRAGGGYTVHARLLTLQLLRSDRGTFVSVKA